MHIGAAGTGINDNGEMSDEHGNEEDRHAGP